MLGAAHGMASLDRCAPQSRYPYGLVVQRSKLLIRLSRTTLIGDDRRCLISSAGKRRDVERSVLEMEFIVYPFERCGLLSGKSPNS